MARVVLRLLVVVAVLVAAAFAGLYYLRPTTHYVPVKRGVAAFSVPGTVTIRAERVYRVVTEVAGRIAENQLAAGQTVAEGDVLARIDSKATEIAIAQTRGRLAAVERQLELGSTRRFELETAQQRLTFLEAQLLANVIAPSVVDEQKRVVQSLEQAVELEKNTLQLSRNNLTAELDTQQLTLERMTLRSPIAGEVSLVEARAGDLVGVGTLIAEIISVTRLVDMKVSQENFVHVKIGQDATVRLAGGQRFPAKVAKLPTTADPETQRYVVELEVTAGGAKLVPGTTGEAVITVAERANSLLVPRPALIGDNLYVVDGSRVTLRKVSVGYTALNEAEILDGVAEGELVAVDNLDELRDGTRVRAEPVP